MGVNRPMGKHIVEAHEMKKSKYDELQVQCQTNGWKASCLPIEVGSRGFTARSVCKALSDIGLIGAKKGRQLNRLLTQLKEVPNGYG